MTRDVPIGTLTVRLESTVTALAPTRPFGLLLKELGVSSVEDKSRGDGDGWMVDSLADADEASEADARELLRHTDR